jgi:hypothetical protein
VKRCELILEELLCALSISQVLTFSKLLIWYCICNVLTHSLVYACFLWFIFGFLIMQLVLMKRGSHTIYSGSLGRNSHKVVEYFEVCDMIFKLLPVSHSFTSLFHLVIVILQQILQ